MRRAICLVSVLALICLTASVTAQTPRTWNAATGLWSNNDNWNPAGALAGGDSVTFSVTGSGGINTNDIAALSLNAFQVIRGEHTTDLDGDALTLTDLTLGGSGTGISSTLNVTNGAMTVAGMLQVGTGSYAHAYVKLAPDVALQVGTSPGSRGNMTVGTTFNGFITNETRFIAGKIFNAYVTNLTVGTPSGNNSNNRGGSWMDLTAVTNAAVLDILTSLRVGAGRGNFGELLLSDSIDLKLGSDSTPASLLDLGYYPQPVIASRLVMGKGRFDVYLDTLQIGHGVTSSCGILDATNVVGGVLDVRSAVRIGTGNIGQLLIGDNVPVKIGVSPEARAEFSFGTGSTTAELTVGTNSFSAYINEFKTRTAQSAVPLLDLGNVQQGIFDVGGDFWMNINRSQAAGPAQVFLSDGFVTKIGDPASRVNFIMAEGDRPGAATFRAGGTFNAHLTGATLANATSASSQSGKPVELNLAAVTNGTFDIDGDLLMGVGLGAEATVVFPAFTAFANNITMGSLSTGSKAHLLMTGTVFSVTGDIVMDGPSAANKAQILTTLNGASGGLDLTDSATLTVNQGLIHITFAAEPDELSEVYWGLRWEGHRFPELKALADAGKLTWDDSAIAPLTAGIFKAGGYTYVGAFTDTLVEAWPATDLTVSSATLNGRMAQLGDWDGDDVDVYFCWGTTDGLTTATSDWQNVVFAVNSPDAGDFFDSPLTALDYGVPIYYRAYATNHTALKETWSHVEVFTPVVHPTVEASAASDIARSRATLNAEVTDTGRDTPLTGFIWWKHGDSSTNLATLEITDGAFSHTPTDLDGGTEYRFQAWASNMAGISWSDTLEFETLPVVIVDYVWDGPAGGSWYVSTNWDPEGIPDEDDNVLIGSGKSVILEEATPVLGAFVMTNATLTLTNLNTQLKADSINISGGSLALEDLFAPSTAVEDRIALVSDSQSLALTSYRVLMGEHALDLADVVDNVASTVTFSVGAWRDAPEPPATGSVAVINSGSGNRTLAISGPVNLAADDVSTPNLSQRVSGHAVFDPNVTLKIGTATARPELSIADSRLLWTSGDRDGSLTVRGGIEAWLSDLRMSCLQRTISGSAYVSLIDLSDAAGFVDISGNFIEMGEKGTAQLVVGDEVDFRMGSPEARGGSIEMYGPARINFGGGGLDMYFNNWTIAGTAEFIATNVSSGVLDIAGNLKLGASGAQYETRRFNVLLSDGIAVKVGDPAQHSNWDMGFGTYAGTNEFRAGANRFEAYLNRLVVGRQSSGTGGDQKIDNLTQLDLSRPLYGTLVVTNEVRIADTNGFLGGLAFRSQYVNSTVTLGDGFVTTIGTPSVPAAMGIGHGIRWGNNSFQAGGTFNANLSGLVVGWRMTDEAHAGLALLDLTTVTNGTLDVAGDMIVGRGRDAVAEVKLGDLAASVTDLYIGSTDTGAKGSLTLKGTEFAVTGNITLDGPTVNNAGTIQVELEGTPAGLILASAATATVNQGLIHIVFKMPTAEMPPPHYWGLRWEGNKVTELEALAAADKLTWDDSDLTDMVIHPVQIYQSGGYTYVGARMGRRGTILTIR